jgi:protein SCO1/2
MSTRTTRLMLLLAAFLGGLACVLAGVLILAPRQGGSLVNSAALSIGGPFRLIDHNGRTLTDADLKGEPYLVFFGFTHCPDVCPTTLLELSDVLDKLGADAEKVRVLFITVDPERDQPEALKTYLSSFNPRVIGLTGDLPAVAAVAKEYHVYMKKVPLQGDDYTMDHTALVYLMDRNGRFVAPFNLSRQPEEAAADLRRYL